LCLSFVFAVVRRLSTRFAGTSPAARVPTRCLSKVGRRRWPKPALRESLQDPYATRGLPELSFYDDRSKYGRETRRAFWALACLSMGFMERGSAISPWA